MPGRRAGFRRCRSQDVYAGYHADPELFFGRIHEISRSPQPVLDGETGDAQKVAHVICDTNGTHCDGLSSNKWIHAPYLLAGLFEVTPNGKGLSCRCLVERQHARAP